MNKIERHIVRYMNAAKDLNQEDIAYIDCMQRASKLGICSESPPGNSQCVGPYWEVYGVGSDFFYFELTPLWSKEVTFDVTKGILKIDIANLYGFHAEAPVRIFFNHWTPEKFHGFFSELYIPVKGDAEWIHFDIVPTEIKWKAYTADVPLEEAMKKVGMIGIICMRDDGTYKEMDARGVLGVNLEYEEM